MDAKVPDKENFIPFLICINLAAHIVLVPLSTEIIALSFSSLETVAATNCGLIDLSLLSLQFACSLSNSVLFFIASCLDPRNSGVDFSLFFNKGINAESTRFESPTKPTCVGY